METGSGLDIPRVLGGRESGKSLLSGFVSAWKQIMGTAVRTVAVNSAPELCTSMD